MDGITKVEVEQGKRPVKVTFDPTKVDTKTMLTALAEKHEEAKLVQ